MYTEPVLSEIAKKHGMVIVTAEKQNYYWLKTEKFFIRPEIKLSDRKLNDIIDVSFNMKGKVEMVYEA